jgi:hypothetical protein
MCQLQLPAVGDLSGRRSVGDIGRLEVVHVARHQGQGVRERRATDLDMSPSDPIHDAAGVCPPVDIMMLAP